MKHNIGDIHKIGIGTFNIDTQKHSEYVDAEIVEVGEDSCKFEMIDFGGPILTIANCYIK